MRNSAIFKINFNFLHIVFNVSFVESHKNQHNPINQITAINRIISSLVFPFHILSLRYPLDPFNCILLVRFNIIVFENLQLIHDIVSFITQQLDLLLIRF